MARKNAIIARALQDRCLTLSRAMELLYEPALHDTLLDYRPDCRVAATILQVGCSLGTLEDRLLKWSPDLGRLLQERLLFLLLCSQRVLYPEALVEALRRRPTLSLEELELVAPLREPRLLPLFLRTLAADLDAWPADAANELRARALAAAASCPLEQTSSSLVSESVDARHPAAVARWLDWWRAVGRHRYPDPLDALPHPPPAPPPPVRLLPEGGGEFTLDPPVAIYYVGRHFGRPEVVFLRPRASAPLFWRTCLSRAAAAVLDGDRTAPTEFEGTCALEGYRIHQTGRQEAIRLSIPDPRQPIAWLACSECGHAGYVYYAVEPDDLPLPGSFA